MATLTLERRSGSKPWPPETFQRTGLAIRRSSADLLTPPLPGLPTPEQFIDAAAFLRNQGARDETTNPEYLSRVLSFFLLAAEGGNGHPTKMSSKAREEIKQGWICLAWAGAIKTQIMITEPTFYPEAAQNEALARHRQALADALRDPPLFPTDPDDMQTTADLCRMIANLKLICPPNHLAVTSSQLGGNNDFTDNWPEGTEVLWHLVRHSAEELTPEAIQAHQRFWRNCRAVYRPTPLLQTASPAPQSQESLCQTPPR